MPNNSVQSNRGPPNSGRKKSRPDSAALYHPSVFRFSCRGKLSLDSKLATAGTCKGVQSQLEHIDHWHLTTRDEAIRVFQQRSGDNEETVTNGNAVQQGDATAAAAAQSLRLISNVLVYPSKENEDKTSVDDEKDETWKCYGSTVTDLLVLRPQNSKRETIAAVAPYCAPGMTIRDVAAPTLGGRDRTSTIRLGVVEIVYQSSISENEEQEEEQQVQQYNDANKASPQKSINQKQEITPVPTRIWNSGTNVLKNMQMNTKLLYQATQENFPQRSYDASERIVQEFRKTLDRTSSLMKRAIFWDWDDDNDGDSKKR